MDYPALLEFPPPRLPGYSRESTIAEEFEAMVRLGLLNSRMKDFYDTWLLSREAAQGWVVFDADCLARWGIIARRFTPGV